MTDILGKVRMSKVKLKYKEEIKTKNRQTSQGRRGKARKEKNILIGATLVGSCSHRCFFLNGTHTVCLLDADSF